MAPERGMYVLHSSGWGTQSAPLLKLYAHVSDGRCYAVPDPPLAGTENHWCDLPEGEDPKTYVEFTEYHWGRRIRRGAYGLVEVIRIPMGAGQRVALTYGECPDTPSGESPPPFAMPEIIDEGGESIGFARLGDWRPANTGGAYYTTRQGAWCHVDLGADYSATTLNVSDHFFEAPASGIELAVADTLDWGDVGLARIHAVHPDGAPAPWDRSPLTFSTSEPAWLSANGSSGFSVTTSTGAVSAYLSTSAEDATACDLPIEVSVSGGGFSDSKRVIIRGTGEAGTDTTATSDTLYVSLPESPVREGLTATVWVSATPPEHPPPCVEEEEVTVSLELSSAAYGVLEYDGRRGATLTDVPLEDASGGAVRFQAADLVPCDTTSLRVSAIDSRGREGTGLLAVMGNLIPVPTSLRDTLYVDALPPTVQSGESAGIRVSTIPAGNGCVGQSDSTRVSIGLSGTTYGVLEYEDQRGAAVYGVPLPDAEGGAVRFIADGEAPCDTTEVGLFVFDERGRRGIGSVSVVDTTTSASGRGAGVCLPVEQRARALWELLEENPYGLLDIPCDEIREWLEVGRHEVPDQVARRLQGGEFEEVVVSPDGVAFINPRVHLLTEAAGGIVNMDYFSLTITDWGDLDPAQAFEQIRRNFNLYIDPAFAELEPYPAGQDASAEWAKWRSNDPLGTVLIFNIINPFGPIPRFADRASVVMSDYQSGSRWRFSTVWTPVALGHPVSGNREFGLVNNQDGTYTFYTRGVDRTTAWYDEVLADGSSVFLEEPIQFIQADRMWTQMMQRALRDLQLRRGSGYLSAAVTKRSNWDSLESYFNTGLPSIDNILNYLSCND